MAKRFRLKTKEKMKHNQVIAGFLFALFLLVITACGGGGPGTTSTTSTTSTTGTFTSIRMEALINGTSTSIDPTNIFVNEQIKFRLTGVNDSSVRVVIPTSGYSLSGTPGGSIDSTGLFSASSSPTGLSGTVSVTFDTLQYTSAVKVVTPAAILVGLGRTTSGAPAKGVQIRALNSGGSVVATGTIATTGAIRMSVPTSAVRFTANFAAVDSVPPLYYARQFAYGGKDYSTTIASCTAPLPALTNGVASNLLTDVVFYANSSGFPPPPPDGCQ
jgi:hypothetical protein